MMTKGAPDRHPGVAGLARHPPRRPARAPDAVRCAPTSPATTGSTCPTGRRRCASTGDCTCSPAHRLSDERRRRRRDRRRRFTFDPADPTPTIGGRLLSPEGGYRDDTRTGAARRRRSTSPATRWPPTSTSSAPRSSSWPIAADNPHNDVFVRISEVDADGPLDATSATDSPRYSATDSGAGAHSNSTPSPTDSRPARGSGSWSPAARIRASSAISAPASPPISGRR